MRSDSQRIAAPTAEQASTVESIHSGQLNAGDSVTISWIPRRECTLRYLGRSRFAVEKALNSAIVKGDSFFCSDMIQGRTLSVNNLLHKGEASESCRTVTEPGPEMISLVRSETGKYVEDEILPRYDAFDKGHNREHIRQVIEAALLLSIFYDADKDMVLVAAAFHDLGICEGRERHHLVSGRIIRETGDLRRWFDEGQIETIACAAEDHRASSGCEPRGIYGKIIAEADRQIVPETVLLRCVQYGLDHFPGHDREWHWQRVVEHLQEKYAEGGYLKLWLPESPNAARLAELRNIISDRAGLRRKFDTIFDKENSF